MRLLVLVITILAVLLLGCFAYIVFLHRQLQHINHLLSKRLSENTRQPIHLELLTEDLNTLATNINKCLKAEEILRLESIREEKRFKEIIANIAHDLRTPLTAIKGYQQLIEKDQLTDYQQEKLQIAQKHAKELGRLIASFFEYSYLISSDIKLHMERINITNLLTECLAESVISFEEKGLSIVYEEASNIFVMADREMTLRMLHNLIRNCIIHSAGDIEVSIVSEDNAKISFRNPIRAGHEIDINRIFDRFYTADKARNKTTTGLGLHIVKLLAGQMGGRTGAVLQDNKIEIWVELPIIKD